MSELSTGFKSFWKKSDKTPPPQNDLKIVEQDPITKRKTNRISRLLKHGSPASSQEDAEEGTAATAQKRRQQVYQAQKRHRNRKAEYVQELEAEVARLQHLDSVINSEKNTLAYQNQAMRDLLASQSLEAHLGSISMSSSSRSNTELSQLGSATVDTRFDPEMGHERTFLDLPDFSDMAWTSDETSTEGSQATKPLHPVPVAGDSWAALDFILALEWPCREHIKHHALNPDAQVPEACKIDEFHGHALTATAAVYQSAQPPPSTSHERSALLSNIPNQKGLQPNSADHWQLPHSEIDKLVELSELLKLDDESMTPAQAYTAVRETVPNDKFLRPTLDALKKPLGSMVQCHGFGACMDAPSFWQHLDGTIQSLQFTHPELAQ